MMMASKFNELINFSASKFFYGTFLSMLRVLLNSFAFCSVFTIFQCLMTNAADEISVPTEMIHDLKFAFDHMLNPEIN